MSIRQKLKNIIETNYLFFFSVVKKDQEKVGEKNFCEPVDILT